MDFCESAKLYNNTLTHIITREYLQQKQIKYNRKKFYQKTFIEN